MGVTIHFSGTLRSATDLAAVRSIASKWAAHWQCEVVDISSDKQKLIRVRDGEVCIYESPVTGAMLMPHPDADPLVLEFDRDLYVQHFCKTQFAPAQVHVEIIEMLQELAPLFEHFAVHDEGGYWGSGDRQHLEQQLALGLDLINKIAAHDGALIAPLLEDLLDRPDRLKHPRYSKN